MRMTARAGAAALLLAATAAAPAAAQQGAGTYRLSGDRVAVYNLAGRVNVVAGTGADVTVEVIPRGADAGELRVLTGAARDREALRVVYPGDTIVYGAAAAGSRSQSTLRLRDDGTFGGDDGRRREGRRITVTTEGRGTEAWADMTVRIPAGRNVAIYHVMGTVEARNVDGVLLLDTHSAAVTASGTRGSLDIDVGSGSVTVTNATGQLRIDTGSGDVTVNGAAGEDVEIDTGSGMVDARGVQTRRLHVDTGSGNVTVNLTTAPSDLSVDTGSGDVLIVAPAGLSGMVEIDTGSGDIESEFPLTISRRERNELRGRIGEGGGRIVIDTGSGDVRLARR